MAEDPRVIAVLGASGLQGGAVVRALRAQGIFRVRALTRNPAAHPDFAPEVALADLDRPETLRAAFSGAHGVFAVTNAFEPGGADERAQGEAAVQAAREAGVAHFIWSTLPDARQRSGGRHLVPHLTNKAKVDAAVAAAGFAHHSFVVAPFYYQNLAGILAPQQQPDGTLGWTLPLDPAARVIAAGDVEELGGLVAGAFADPSAAGRGDYLPLCGDTLSFDDILRTLASRGHHFTFNRVPGNVFATFFPGAAELADMFSYFERCGYWGHDLDAQLPLSTRMLGHAPSSFEHWASTHFAPPAAAPARL